MNSESFAKFNFRTTPKKGRAIRRNAETLGISLSEYLRRTFDAGINAAKTKPQPEPAGLMSMGAGDDGELDLDEIG